MANDILIQRLNRASGDTITYHINNLESLHIETSVPIFRMPIPNTTDWQSIVIKVDGNTTTISVSWLLKDETSNLIEEGSFQVPETVSADRPLIGTFQATTADNQFILLREYFQNSDIVDHYFKIFVRDGSGSNIMEEKGMMSDISFLKDTDNPVTWKASLKFFVGDTSSIGG